MGIIKSINDWEVSVGEGAGDYIQDTLTGTASFLCGLRAKYPNTFFDRSFGRGLANSICSNVGSDAVLPEEGAFSGGQCPGVEYEVLVDGVSRFNNGANQQRNSRLVVFGPIDDIFLGRNSPANSPTTLAVQCFARDSSGNEKYFGDVYGGVGVSGEINSIAINRIDGGLDDCGNVPPSFPPDPPRDSSDFSTTVTVCGRDEDGNEVNCEDVEVVLPEEDAINFPVCVVVDGKKICLDADGWSVEDAPEADEKAADEEEEDEEEEDETEEIEILVAIVVTVDILPTRGTTYVQPNDPGAINFYAGYISWLFEAGDKVVPDSIRAVRRLENYFPAPEDAAGYNVFAVNGAKLATEEIKETITVPKEPTEGDT